MAPLAEPEDNITPLIGVNMYKQNKVTGKRSFRSRTAYQNQKRPFSDGTLEDEPPTIPPKQVSINHSGVFISSYKVLVISTRTFSMAIGLIKYYFSHKFVAQLTMLQRTNLTKLAHRLIFIRHLLLMHNKQFILSLRVNLLPIAFQQNVMSCQIMMTFLQIINLFYHQKTPTKAMDNLT